MIQTTLICGGGFAMFAFSDTGWRPDRFARDPDRLWRQAIRIGITVGRPTNVSINDDVDGPGRHTRQGPVESPIPVRVWRRRE